MKSFATYAPDDTDLQADAETVQQYAGRSALSAVDSIAVHFLRKEQWEWTNRNDAVFRLKDTSCWVRVSCRSYSSFVPCVNSLNSSSEECEVTR